MGQSTIGFSRSSLLVTSLQINTVDHCPLIPPLWGLAKKTAVLEDVGKTVVKGVIYNIKFNNEKTYSGLENQRRYWGEDGQRRGCIGGGGDCTCPLYIIH